MGWVFGRTVFLPAALVVSLSSAFGRAAVHLDLVSIKGCRYSADGKSLTVWGLQKDGEYVFWAVSGSSVRKLPRQDTGLRTQELARRVLKLRYEPEGIAASPAGNRFAVAIYRYSQAAQANQSTLGLYDRSGKRITWFQDQDQVRISEPVFSPDGSTVYFTRFAMTKEIWAWDTRRGKRRCVVSGASGDVSSPTVNSRSGDLAFVVENSEVDCVNLQRKGRRRVLVVRRG